MMRFVGCGLLVGSLLGCSVASSREAPTRAVQVRESVPLRGEVTVPVVASAMAVAAPSAAATGVRAVTDSRLRLKRLVVTTGVKEREPIAGGEALPSDGSPIYAFAELSNQAGESENVRITFERKGGAERVGNVTLPVPGNVGRHRTWAITHFIRAAGVWEAVLWSESGRELGRTSFEVMAS